MHPNTFIVSDPHSNKNLDDIMDAIIPNDGPNEMPTGFSVCGHIGMPCSLHHSDQY